MADRMAGGQRVQRHALQLTPAEADRLRHELAEVIARYPRHESGAELPPGAAIVAAQYQVFPTPGQRP